MTAAPDTNATAIRRRAIQAHGETWRLLELADRTPEQDAAMLKAAEESFDLWKKVGTGVNAQRGAWLVARVHIALRRSVPALEFAHLTLKLSEKHRAILKDFDLAFGEEIAARAYALSGDKVQSARHGKKAQALGKAIADAEDRDVFFTQFEAGPWFGFAPAATDR